MAVRKELDGELVLYAANDTLKEMTASYTIIAYDEAGDGKKIASGICNQGQNSVSEVCPIAVGDTPQLLVIQWTVDGKEYMNHAFTANASYETMERWVRIIGREGNFYDEILELK